MRPSPTMRRSVQSRTSSAPRLRADGVPGLLGAWDREEVVLVARDVHPPPLAIGAPAPDFTLPGIDGKTYSLASFKDHKVLVVIFTAVHCPTAEVYEARIKSLVTDYTPKDVAFVVIQPNNAKALRLDEMGYTDLGDSLEEMKIRAEHRQFNFPFLYDGETQEVAAKYGPVATPHVFVFDSERRLRYQGRVDSNPREALREGPRRAQRHRCRPGRHARRRPDDAHRRLLDQVAREGSAAQRRDGEDRGRARPAREDRG